MHAKTLLFAGLALAGAAQAAEITIYKQPNFAGGEQTFNRDTGSLQGSSVYDQAASIVVRSGRWQLCSQPNFQGDCQVLERGQYATLPQNLNHRIESMREVSQVAQNDDRNRGGDGYANRRDDRRDGYGSSGRPAVVLFADGNSTRYDRDVDSFRGSAYMEGAERLVIREGRWELCAQPDYRGYCRVYEPGLYSNLGRFSSQIGSMRRIG